MKFPGVILVLLQVHFSSGKDPHCSRYHYEEQTLAKIVRMEHRLEELEKHADCHCPDGWVTFQGSCYLFSQAEVNFLDAEHPFTDAHYWMGLSDMDQEGTFKWYGTNDVVSFTDWKSGEPDNGAGIEHCVHFYQGSFSWNDNKCNTLIKAVCEQKQK